MPGTPVDEAIQAAIWDGYRKSPDYFKARNRFWRIAIPAEQFLQGKVLSDRLRSRLKKIIATGVILALTSEQAWEHRKEIRGALEPYAVAAAGALEPYLIAAAESLEESLPESVTEELLPEWGKKILKEAADKSRLQRAKTDHKAREQMTNSMGGKSDRIPVAQKKGENRKDLEKPPTPFVVAEAINIGANVRLRQDHHLVISNEGFSESTNPDYDFDRASAHLSKDYVQSGDNQVTVASTKWFESEKGKLVLPHIEEFLLMEGAIRLRKKGSPDTGTWLFPMGKDTLFPLTRSEKGFYVVDLSLIARHYPDYETDAAHYELKYLNILPASFEYEALTIKDPERVKQLADYFLDAGFSRIAEGLFEEAKEMKEYGYSVYPEDIRRRIEMGSLYAEVNAPPNSIKASKENPFAEFTYLVDEGHLCGQCEESANVGKRALEFLYRDRPEIKVGERILIPSKSPPGKWMIPFHAQNTLQSGTDRQLPVDFTAQLQSPRNEGYPVPTTDVLHSEGQDLAFSPERLPKLQDQYYDSKINPEGNKPTEIPNQEARLFWTSHPSQRKGLIHAFIEGLMHLPTGDHRYRNRGQPVGLQYYSGGPEPLEPLPLKPRPLSPEVRKLLGELELAKQNLIDDATFKKIDARTRQQINVLPLAKLVRSYLLREMGATKFREELMKFIPSSHPKKGDARLSPQEMLKLIAEHQRGIWEKVITATAAGRTGPQVMKVGNPVLAEKVTNLFDLMAAKNIEAMVGPPKAKPGARFALKCLDVLAKIIP